MFENSTMMTLTKYNEKKESCHMLFLLNNLKLKTLVNLYIQHQSKRTIQTTLLKINKKKFHFFFRHLLR